MHDFVSVLEHVATANHENRQKVKEKEQEVQRLEKKHNEAVEKCRDACERNKTCEEEVESLKKLVEEKKNDISGFQSQVAVLTDELSESDARCKVESLRVEALEANTIDLAKQLHEANEKAELYAKNSEELKQTQAALVKTEQYLEQSSQKQQSTEFEYYDCLQQNQKLDELLDELRQEKMNLEQQLEDERQTRRYSPGSVDSGVGASSSKCMMDAFTSLFSFVYW